MTTAQKFLSVFEGSEIAHGQTTVGRTSRGGKAEAKSFIVREPLTEERVAAHLTGGQGVGAIPINSENKTRFGAIDVDDYDLDLAALAARIHGMNIPLVPCRSKSGGAHLYLFLHDWEPAYLVRESLTEIAAYLGFAGREIFPKQDAVLHDRGDLGNFINLPYHNAERTMRYALNAGGEAMSLDEFLAEVEQKRCSLNDLEEALREIRPNSAELKDFPPCLQTIFMLEDVVGRNNVLCHAVPFVKKAFPDHWQEVIEEWNRKYFKVPLSSKELQDTIFKSHGRKDYGPLCNTEPMRSYCDKAACRQCKFGIGGIDQSDANLPELSGLTIMRSDPRLYYVNVDGERLELTIEELNSPREFQKKVLKDLNRRPDLVKDREWGNIVNKLLAEATEAEVAPELTTRGQFLEHLQEFCTSRVRAMAPEELLMGKPWTNRGVTSFKIQGLMDFLKRKDFKGLSRPQVQQVIKDLNSDPDDAIAVMKVKKEDGTSTSVRVWRVPAFDDTEIDLGLDEEEHHVTF